MQQLTTRDYLYVGEEGILSGPQLAAATRNCTLKSFTLSEARLQRLGSDGAILTYIARQDESCNGASVHPQLINQDVFVHRLGKWLIANHMEVEPNTKQ